MSGLYEKDTKVRHYIKNYLAKFPKRLGDDDRLLLAKPITLEELTCELDEALGDKTPGEDGISMKCLKNLWGVCGPALVKEANKIRKTGNLSKDFQRIIITLIPKHGNSIKEINNVRPISLINCALRLISSVVNRRIQKAMINSKIWHNNQHSFIPGRTIQDVTQKLATTIDAIRRHTSSNHAVILIDFRKAFDNINCLYLLLTLTKLNVDDDTIRYCMAVMADHFGQIQLNNRLSSLFKLRQGNPLSPALFNKGLEPLLHKIVQTLTAVKLENGYSVNVLAYADDITIFVDNEGGANLLRKNSFTRTQTRKIQLTIHKETHQ